MSYQNSVFIGKTAIGFGYLLNVFFIFMVKAKYMHRTLEMNYRRLPIISGVLTFEISSPMGRLFSGGRLLSGGAYYQVVKKCQWRWKRQKSNNKNQFSNTTSSFHQITIMFYTDELFDNNFSFISSFISLQSIFSKKKNKKLLRAYFWVGAYFWEALTFGGGAYYRSLISSLQQMRLILGALISGGAYYRKFTVL